MLRWCISLRREISRMAVEGTPSSSCSRRIFLSAIVSLVWRSLALYTTPYVPSPIFSTFSYCAHHHHHHHFAALCHITTHTPLLEWIEWIGEPEKRGREEAA